MELIIIIVLASSLAVLVGVLIWGRFRERRMLEKQGDNLSRVVEEKIGDSLKVFGDLRERLGELTQKAKGIEEVLESFCWKDYWLTFCREIFTRCNTGFAMVE